MHSGQIIGLDIGGKRTGVARASLAARLAQPFAVIATEELQQKLKEIVEQFSPKTIVVGLPRGLEGQETEQTRWVRQKVEELKTGLPAIDFRWQDEALTTVSAETGPDKNTADIDARAASIILQDFLDDSKREEDNAEER